MQKPEITNDAKVLLYRMYEEYEERRGSSGDVLPSIIPDVSAFLAKYSIPNAAEAFKSLASVGFVRNTYESGEIETSRLLPPAIAYMESKDIRALEEIVSKVSTIAEIIKSVCSFL